MTEEIARNRALKVGALCVKGMVVHHIEHHLQTRFVQRLHHLFELTNAHFRLIRIGGIRSLRHIIVQRIVSPIILRNIQFRFIHRSIIERRQNMHIRNAQLLQMIQPSWTSLQSLHSFLCQSEKFSAMFEISLIAHTKIAVMHLIDGATFKQSVGRFVKLPPHRIRIFQVNHSRAFTIHSHRSCVDTGSFSAPLTIYFHFKGIKFPF